MIADTKKSKIIEIATLIIAIIALCLSAVTLIQTQRNAVDENMDTQYVIFLGTNDKDTNQPVFSTEEAKVRAAADEMLEVFNQRSVLIQSNETKSEIYYPSK